jgi:hypothetical protein
MVTVHYFQLERLLGWRQEDEKPSSTKRRLRGEDSIILYK